MPAATAAKTAAAIPPTGLFTPASFAPLGCVAEGKRAVLVSNPPIAMFQVNSLPDEVKVADAPPGNVVEMVVELAGLELVRGAREAVPVDWLKDWRRGKPQWSLSSTTSIPPRQP